MPTHEAWFYPIGTVSIKNLCDMISVVLWFDDYSASVTISLKT